MATRRNDLGPNEGLIGEVNARQRLTTPALVLDLDRFDANLATMARLAKECVSMGFADEAQVSKQAV